MRSTTSYAWTQSYLTITLYIIYLFYSQYTSIPLRFISVGHSPCKSFVKYPHTSKLASDIFLVPTLLIAYRILLDNCSNTAWSYSTSAFTISDRCIAVFKWWFFVWFVWKIRIFHCVRMVFWDFVIMVLSWQPILNSISLNIFFPEYMLHIPQ